MTTQNQTQKKPIKVFLPSLAGQQRNDGAEARADAGESLFLARELEAIEAEQYRADLPPLEILQHIPVRSDIDPGANTITYTMLTQVGRAVVGRAPNGEIPRVDLYRQEFTSPVKPINTKYAFSVDDLEAAQMAKVPLERESADAARRAIAQQVSDIACNGHAATGLPGLFTNPNITRVAFANGAASSPLWRNKTADEILADMSLLASGIVTRSKKTWAPDTMLLPLAQYNLIADKPRSVNSDTTVLAYFLKSNPYIKKVAGLIELEGAGTGGVDMAVCFKADKAVLHYWMVKPFEQRPNQERDWSIEVNCREKSGGVVVKKPLGVAFGEGL